MVIKKIFINIFKKKLTQPVFLLIIFIIGVVSSIKSGARGKMGQRIGFMGKQSTSGGWTHLHFGMYTKDTLSNSWQLEDPYPYPYFWEAII